MASTAVQPQTTTGSGVPASQQSQTHPGPADQPLASGSTEQVNEQNKRKRPQPVAPFEKVKLPETSLAPNVQTRTDVYLDETDYLEDTEDQDDAGDPMEGQATAEELQERQRLLDEGAENALNQESLKIPNEVRNINRELSRLVRGGWWKGGPIPKSHEKSFQIKNEKVEKICHALAESNFKEAFEEELAEQIRMKQIDPNNDQAKTQLRKEFWEYDPYKSSDQKFIYFQRRKTAQPWAVRWKSFNNILQFPQVQVKAHIEALGLGMRKIEELTKELKSLKGEQAEKAKMDELSQAKERVIQGAVVFHKMLALHQLEAKLLIPERYMLLFNDLISESPENTAIYEDFKKQLRIPLEDQNEILQDGRKKMKPFFQQALVADNNTSEMKDSLSHIRSTNQQLVLRNKELGIIPTAFQFPLTELDAMIRYKKSGQYKRVEQIMKIIMADSAVYWEAEDLLYVFPSQIGNVQHPEEKRLEKTRKLLQIMPGDEDVSEKPKPKNPEPSSAPSKSESPSSDVPQSTPPSSSTSNLKQPKQQPFQSSAGIFVKESTSSAGDILDDFDFDDDTIPMMLYDDGRTEHGKLEATRPSPSGDVRFSRFIVNAGTDDAPFYKAIKASDIGPGGAETFHEDKWKSLHTRFNLTQRKTAMKEVGGCTIKALGPCVEMAREPSDKRTKKGKPYRADLYVKVEYHDDKARNPHASTLPLIEWLTRTELGQLVGKKYAEAQEQIMMARYKKRQAYFEECKRRKLHPRTKMSLTATDSEEYPWLFPDGTCFPKGVAEESKEEEDYNMSGVKVDGADGDDEY